MKGIVSRRIKVLIVVNDFLIGGAQKLIVDLLVHSNRTRFEYELLTLFRFSDDEREYLYSALPKDVPVHELCFRGVSDLASWRALYQTLRKINPDVVLANLFFSNTVIRMLAPFFRYRVLTVEHNTYTKKTKLHQMIDRVLAPLSARIIAVSKTVAVFTAQQESINPAKFIVIHNGIDIAAIRAEFDASDPSEVRSEFGFAPEDRVIVNVARVVPQKNHRLLIDGFALFVAAHPHHRLLIVGGGSHLEKTREYVTKLDLDNKVRFLGYRKDIPHILSVADFFAATSLIEGFGITHAEALACGVPVLSTKTAGPDEMIAEGVNGYFISEYTPESVAEGMQKMTAGDLAAMRTAAARSAEAYSIERAVRAYEDLYQEMIPDSHRGD